MTIQRKSLHAIVNQDGAAILETESGRISILNTTGAIVWQGLKRGEEVETIAEGLARQTGEQIEAVRKDIADFVQALKKQDLLPS